MTGMQFARHIRVKYPTLMYWVQRRWRESQGSAAPAGPRWLEAVLEPHENVGAGMVVEVPGGLRLIVKESGQARVAGELLRVLEPTRRDDLLPKAARRVSRENQFGQSC